MTPAVTHMVLLFDGGFRSCVFVLFFFFNDTATTEIYTLSLHDALPISLDLIGDVRDHLHRGAEVVAATLLGDDALVDAPGGEIAVAAGRGAHETLVVPEVEIGLGAVLGNEHLAVLERAHGARVDVDVRIELDHPDLESPRLEDRAERGGGDPLA